MAVRCNCQKDTPRNPSFVSCQSIDLAMMYDAFSRDTTRRRRRCCQEKVFVPFLNSSPWKPRNRFHLLPLLTKRMTDHHHGTRRHSWSNLSRLTDLVSPKAPNPKLKAPNPKPKTQNPTGMNMTRTHTLGAAARAALLARVAAAVRSAMVQV